MKFKENHVCHVRPHARVGLDYYELPITDKITEITHTQNRLLV